MKKNHSVQEIFSAIADSKNPICCVDYRLDFDAVCAPASLRHVLTNYLGKDIRVTYEESILPRIREISKKYFDVSFIEENISPKSIDFAKHDLLIFLDSGNSEHITKLNDFRLPEKIKVINIDHHKDNPFFGDLNYVKLYGSTCSLMYELFSNTDTKIDTKLGQILLLGIISDTGFFQNVDTTSYEFQIAAELKRLGCNTYDIIWELTFNETVDDMKMRKLIFNNMRIDLNEKVAYSYYTLEEIKMSQIDLLYATYPPADMLKRLKGVDFVFVVKELVKDEKYNISFRSHHDIYDVSYLTKNLGGTGGGHKMAAGCVVSANSIDEVIKTVLNTNRLLSPVS